MSAQTAPPVLEAFRAEAGQLAGRMAALTPADWARPTSCTPWNVAELLGHVLTVVSWLPGMLSAPAPDRAEISAADYYRPDDRFSAQTNSRRIELARTRAANAGDGHALALEFDATWREVADLCAQQPADRVVRTRHGDAMLLNDFLTTRIVEVGIHGLDLAAALARPPWLTPPAARVLTDLLFGKQGAREAARLGWDAPTALSKATGRQPMTKEEAAHLAQADIHWLTLG